MPCYKAGGDKAPNVCSLDERGRWSRTLSTPWERELQRDQSLGCAGADHLAGSCPIPRSVISEPKTVLPSPHSPLSPCRAALSVPVSFLTLEQLGRCTYGEGPVSDQCPS